MSRDQVGKGLLAVVAAVALCCGAAVVLVSAGVLAVGGGLFGSPELTIAAVALAAFGLWRLVAGVLRHQRTTDDGKGSDA